MNNAVMDKLLVVNGKTYDEVMPELISNANDIASKCVDYSMSKPRDKRFTMNDCSNVSFIDGIAMKRYSLTDYSTYQLCCKLGMPNSYFQKLSSTNFETEEKQAIMNSLACKNVNTLLKMYDGSFFVRAYDDKVRAILTTKYSDFDTDKILDIVDDSFKTNGMWSKDNVSIRGVFQNYERFHMRFTETEPITGIEDKDLYCGLSIDSSDVGKSKLTVRFFIYKQLCTNGLCIMKFNKELFSQKHVGIKEDEFREGLRKSLWSFPTIAAKAKDIIVKAGSINLAENDLYDLTAEHSVTKKVLQSYLKVCDKDIDKIVTIATTKYPRTLFGVVNAVTEYAQYTNFEKRIELERLAGDILVNPRIIGIAA